jgi:hypothetical protein
MLFPRATLKLLPTEVADDYMVLQTINDAAGTLEYHKLHSGCWQRINTASDNPASRLSEEYA